MPRNGTQAKVDRRTEKVIVVISPLCKVLLEVNIVGIWGLKVVMIGIKIGVTTVI